MTVYFSTDWTLNPSILTEVDSVITLHPNEIQLEDENSNVCLIAENELGEIIATSGCGEEEPLITERFIRFWANEGFPAQMDIEISELYLEDNQLPSPPSEIYLETDQPFITSETEAIEVEEFYNEHPTGGEHVDKFGNPYKTKGEFAEFINNEGEHFSKQVDKLMNKQVSDWREMEETRQIKHVLIKRKDLPKRVDFEMLVNSSHLIWNAGHLLGLGQDPNNEVITLGQEAVKNLELFLSLMPNPKFATLSSFQIEKYHGKN